MYIYTCMYVCIYNATTVMAGLSLDVQKLIKVLRWSLPQGSKLGNSQKVHGIEFAKVHFWPD
jgi:hypothetical protein